MRLTGKVAIITGGSKGIGRAVAAAYLEEGAYVAICSRSREELDKTHRELKKYYKNIYSLKCNIAKESDCVILYEKVLKHWNRVDILVNNAGILGDRLPLESYPDKTWKDVMDINVNGTFYMIKHAIPIMRKQNSGSIINLSSGVGRKGSPYWGAYSVSKFGVEALTQIAAEELFNFNIRVNAVNPGRTRTQMHAKAFPKEDQLNFPTPSKIVPVFVYLASDESIGKTGLSFNASDYMQQ